MREVQDQPWGITLEMGTAIIFGSDGIAQDGETEVARIIEWDFKHHWPEKPARQLIWQTGGDVAQGDHAVHKSGEGYFKCANAGDAITEGQLLKLTLIEDSGTVPWVIEAKVNQVARKINAETGKRMECIARFSASTWTPGS